MIDAGYGRAAARLAFFFPGGGLPASRTEAETRSWSKEVEVIFLVRRKKKR